MAGVYLHIPFCKRICAYCDFYKSARLDLLNGVVERMHRELEERAPFLRGERVESIYFGGGTPSLLPPPRIEEFVQQCRKLFDCSSLEEVTIEANPDDLDEAYLGALRQSSVDRLSIGIQSFDEEELRLMNRRHTAQQARRAVQEARRVGFENLTVDLIFGVEGFGGERLKRKVAEILALDVPHISAYHLTIEPNTAFGRRVNRGEMRPVREEVSEEEFAYIHEELTKAGYEHYEVSNYAKKGYRARHNAAYWAGKPYLGIGPAAHSFDGERRCWSIDTVERYVQAEKLGFEEEKLTTKDQLNEMIMTRLRCSEGLSLEAFSGRFGVEAKEALLRRASQFLAAGMLQTDQRRLYIEPHNFLLSDYLIEGLFEV